MKPKIRRVTKDRGGSIPQRPAPQGGVQASFAQERMFVLNQLRPDVSVYGTPAHYWLHGSLNIAALERTLTALLWRHEPLRTVFRFEGEQLFQVIREPMQVSLDCVDLTYLPQEQAEKQALDIAVTNTRKPFDLENDIPVRWQLVRVSPQRHLLVQTFHHIAYDGWSARILNDELSHIYAAYAADAEPELTPLPIQYADFAQWQREMLGQEQAEEHLHYWLNKLSGELPVLDIVSDRLRLPEETFEGGLVEDVMPPEAVKALRSLGQKHGATLFMVLLAAYKVLLHRYTAATDIIVGCPVAGREVTEVEPLIGLFINTLVLRTDLSAKPTFIETLARVRQVCIEGFAHQNSPFELLVQRLNPPRTSSPNPIFQALFQLRNMPVVEAVDSDVIFETCPVDIRLAVADFGIAAEETPEGLKLKAEFCTDLFDVPTIRRMLGHYKQLLYSILDNPEQCISHLGMLTETERKMQLHEWNQTIVPFPQDKCLHNLFEEWATIQPAATAVIHNGDEYTYDEVNANANRIAHHLIALGIGVEEPVVLYMKRHVGLLEALIGVMKAGAVVIPVDHRHPAGRIADVLANSGAAWIVTEKALASSVPQCGVNIFPVDEDEMVLQAYPCSCPVVDVRPRNLAYILYTSGSTGKPKGVAVEHRGAVCRVCSAESMKTAGARDGVIVAASISFDVSIYEIFCGLCHGLHVVLVDSALEFLDSLPPGRYGHMNCPPSVLRELLRYEALPRCIRTLLVGAEVVTREDVACVMELGHIEALYNMYGPTEAIMWCTSKLIDAPSTTDPTIGRPAANTSAYVLDDNLQPVPVGVSGELWIGGEGLARCYYNAPELTAKAFLPDPFSGTPGGRIYRTGDVVKYRSDGEIEFLGRRDRQVKIRGFRIELDGVQSTLNEHPDVAQSVVTVTAGAAENDQLVAYIVPVLNSQDIDINDLQHWLSERIPDYMIPDIFVRLKAIPLLTSGKVDFQSLPVPQSEQPSDGIAVRPPETPVEIEIAAIFSEVLHRTDLNVQSHFFDLGGHSLMATMAVSRIRDLFGIQMPIGVFFAHPTVEGVALSVTELMLKNIEEDDAEATLNEFETNELLEESAGQGGD